MIPYTLIASRSGRGPSDVVGRFEAAVDAQGWRREALSPRVTLAVGPGPSLDVQSLGSWRLMGDVFRRGPAWSREIDTPETLIDQVWGRYVANQLTRIE